MKKYLLNFVQLLEGDDWKKEEFVDRMKLIDEMIIDQSPLADKFVSRYKKNLV